jgi:hypothetical protein
VKGKTLSITMLAPRLYIVYNPRHDYYSVGLARGSDAQWRDLRMLVKKLINQEYLLAGDPPVDRQGCSVFRLGSIANTLPADESIGDAACSFLEKWLKQQWRTSPKLL